MSDESFTAYGMFGFLVYAGVALLRADITFNWKLAFGVLIGIIIIDYGTRYLNKLIRLTSWRDSND